MNKPNKYTQQFANDLNLKHAQINSDPKDLLAIKIALNIRNLNELTIN